MKDIELNNISTSGGDVAGHDIVDNSQGKIEFNAPVIIGSGAITEERARLICREEYQKILQNWSFEAGALVEKRIMTFEDKVLPKMLEYDNTLKIFADPSFQMLIRKAQQSAACSDNNKDIELLADLVLHRAKENENRERRIGISKAIEIVHEVDTTALVAISLVYAFLHIYPLTNEISKGLDVIDSLYAKIKGNIVLPTNEEWLEHLDILSVVRLNSLGGFKKAKDCMCDALKYYLTVGIDKSSEDYRMLVEEMSEYHMPLHLFIEEHPLRSGFIRWCAPNDIKELSMKNRATGEITRIELSEKQREIIRKYHDKMVADGSNMNQLRDSFWKLYCSYPNLNNIADWWDSFQNSFDITPIGVALANAYLHGIDPSIPQLY